MLQHSRAARNEAKCCFLFKCSLQWKDLLPLRPAPAIEISKPLSDTPKRATLRLDSSCDLTPGSPTVQLPKTLSSLSFPFFFFFKKKVINIGYGRPWLKTDENGHSLLCILKENY